VIKMNEEDIEFIIDTLLQDAKTKETYDKGQSVGRNIIIHMNNNPHLFARLGPVATLLGLCEAYKNTVYNLIAQSPPAHTSEKRDQAIISMAQEMLRMFIKNFEDFRDPEPRENVRSQFRERKAEAKW
jgi:hypothetical protein